jgi:hypothetical protein
VESAAILKLDFLDDPLEADGGAPSTMTVICFSAFSDGFGCTRTSSVSGCIATEDGGAGPALLLPSFFEDDGGGKGGGPISFR